MKEEETPEQSEISPSGERKPYRVKVCGMKFPENIREVAALPIDYMGFIFYPRSPRYAKLLDTRVLDMLPRSIEKVGVFVNENLENILTCIRNFKLDAVQLHGAENKGLCLQIREEAKTKVIKAFPVMSRHNLKVTKAYEEAADLFLFDTKTDSYGGSGQKFDWNILYDYQGATDFLLSGGIGVDDVKAIRKLHHPKMVGVDINSRFEVSPGLKDVALLRQFIEELKMPDFPKEENKCE